MLTRLYILLLYLYPDHYRSKFGGEMISVFEQAHADASRKDRGLRFAFGIRELCGLIADVFRVQAQMADSCPEPWIWSLEAPVAAVLLYGFCVWRAEEMG